MNAILFGNLALLSGLLCLAGLGWAWQQESRRRWLVALLLGAAGGLLASALSGTRGGWLALPLATLVFHRAWLRGWPARWRWLTVGAVALLLAGLYLTPQSGVQQRVGVAMSELVEQGRISPGMDRYWHAHNDLLDAWVRRGLPALLVLLALYLLPLWVFTPPPRGQRS